MHYVNGVRMMYGYGEIRQGIAGEFQEISIRTVVLSYVAETSNWDRIAWIAEIQSRTWMYSGPYGYGDMDMLGRLIASEANSRGGKWRVDFSGTTDSFQFMGSLKESFTDWYSCTSLVLL